MAKEKEVTTKKEKPIYAALDSNVLTYVAYLYKLDNKGKEFDPALCKDEYVKGNYSNINKLYTAIKEDRVRPVVLNTVFGESSIIDTTMRFIKDFGYFPNFTIANMDAKLNEIERMAEMYCEPLDLEDKHISPAMKKHYSASNRKWEPCNDAYAMAEATVAGVQFVTANEKDFLYTNEDFEHNKRQSIMSKEDRHFKKTRAERITIMNRHAGYVDKKGYSPRPIGFRQFVADLDNKKDMIFTNPIMRLEKAEDVMGDNE